MVFMVNNVEINEKDKICLVYINPQIYSLDVIYSAAYVFIDKAYIIIDGNPKKEIKVIIKPKENYDLNQLGMEFNNELLNYAVYKKQSDKNRGIRETIMQRALITNDPSIIDKNLFNEETENLEDIEKIAIPWEEKYGKKRKK